MIKFTRGVCLPREPIAEGDGAGAGVGEGPVGGGVGQRHSAGTVLRAGGGDGGGGGGGGGAHQRGGGARGGAPETGQEARRCRGGACQRAAGGSALTRTLTTSTFEASDFDLAAELRPALPPHALHRVGRGNIPGSGTNAA
eukprot:1184972-Prorocentrum_minimum.AAC.5